MEEPATACASDITPMRMGSAAWAAMLASASGHVAATANAMRDKVMFMESPW
jgi:hypothetical protein